MKSRSKPQGADPVTETEPAPEEWTLLRFRRALSRIRSQSSSVSCETLDVIRWDRFEEGELVSLPDT